MRAGRLRHRISFEVPEEIRNEYGEAERFWVPILTTSASREDLAGREYFAAEQMQSEVTTRFRIRWRSGILPTMRIVSEGVVYDVRSVQDPDGRKRELIIMARRHG
jgi:SPP1 family predicted phage head-tail adaptor